MAIMNKTKRVFSLLLLCLVIASVFTLSGCKEKELEPTEKFYVNDFSNVLDDSAEEQIVNEGRALNENKKTKGAQVVVVTVETINNEDISEYAVELGRKWGIGKKGEDNGVLILLVTKDRNVHIATGYGLEGALPDVKLGRILDNYAIPDFKKDNFQAGILKTYKAVINEVYNEYGIRTDDYVPTETLPESSADDISPKQVIISWIILAVLVILYMLVFRRRGVMFIPMGFGGFRGGFGGGGSHGGFGGFSGGGGSFGGGGAGRGF